jgi:hypothetical protein
LLTYFRLGWKILPGTNTLAYWVHSVSHGHKSLTALSRACRFAAFRRSNFPTFRSGCRRNGKHSPDLKHAESSDRRPARRCLSRKLRVLESGRASVLERELLPSGGGSQGHSGPETAGRILEPHEGSNLRKGKYHFVVVVAVDNWQLIKAPI